MNTDEMEPFVFAVVPKKQEKKLRRNYKDLVSWSCSISHFCACVDILLLSLLLSWTCRRTLVVWW